MARESGQKMSVIPRLTASRLKRYSELKIGSPLKGGSKVETDTPQDTGSSRLDAASPTPLTKEDKKATHDDTNSSSSSSHEQAPIDPSAMDPIFLGEDFSALIKLPAISRHENLWIDLWQQIEIGPLDGQYLSSLKSFVGLRCLRVTGMLKSYQKQLFQAIWKMDRLEDLQLRMAEEPCLEPGVVSWRRIEEGWVPRMQEAHVYVSPGDGKGRIKPQYGKAEYLDNCVIELAKPKLPQTHPDFENWMTRLLPIAHLTLRGFVVDAIPFCSCFDGQTLRSITLADCYDAGFYLPHEMDGIEIRVDGSRMAKAACIRQVAPGDMEVKRVTLKKGKKVEEYPAAAVAVANAGSRGRRSPDQIAEHQGRRQVDSSSTSSPSSASPSKHGGRTGRTPRFPWHFRSRVFNAVIEEDEREG